ncbi:MAG: RHS repeat-associated core domain-containing protein, partial [Paludibacteraceae bacterium]|nr:RHS repeat-associated core domain-containing protein [Paludibacteraceae bacterium]
YVYYNVKNGSELEGFGNDGITEKTSLFMAPKTKKSIAYEYQTDDETHKKLLERLELSKETYDYTKSYGNLFAYSFRDLTNKTDNGFVGYDDTIQYSDQKLGLATSVEVKGTDGTLYRKVTAQYNDKRTPTAMTQMVQHLDGGKKAVSNFKYDQYGNMVRRTFPTEEMDSKKEIEPAKDSSFFEYEYDRKYHMYPERVTDAFGYRGEMEDYDYRYGIPRTVRDMNGYTVRYHIDDLGRTDTIVAPNEQSDGVPYTISYKYVLGGNYTNSYAVTNHYDPQHPNNPLQTVTHVDGLGRPYQVKKDAEIHGKGEKMIVSGRVKYDALGRTVETYHPSSCALADATKIVAFNDKLLNSSTYDAIDRPLTQTLPGDESGDEDLNLKGAPSETVMTYSIETADNDSKTKYLKTTVKDPKDNNQYSYTNGAGQTVRTARDYMKMKEEDSESMEEKVYGIDYVYDPIGQLLTVTDAGGNVTSYTYDMAGRKLSVEHPSAGLTTFAYDVAGNLVKKQTQNLMEANKFITYTYHKNRLEKVDYPDHGENNVTYTYGGVNAPHNRVGRLALIEDGSGATEFFYGRMGEVTKQRRTLVIPNQAVATYTTEWTYDSHNRIQSMTYPDGEVVSYRYNLGGLLSSVSGKKDYTYDYVEEIGYDEYEQKIYMKYGNGVETTYDYSTERRRLDTLVVMNQEGKIMDNAYFYDQLDNITKLVNNGKAQKTKEGKTIGGGVTHDYTYDAWNRLIKASGTFSGADDKSAKYDLFMAYDELYNVTSKKLNVEQTNLQFPGTLKAGHTLKYQYDRENNDPFRLLSVSASEYRVAVEKGEDPEAPVEEDKMVKTRNEYAFDANGNQTQVATGKDAKEDVEEMPQANLRQLHWDEENRLLAINDNGHVSSYFYDAGGERTVKMSAGMEKLFINGSSVGDEKEFDAKFVAYVSPYLVLKNGGEYTKHIYAGTERIASKIGDFESFGADPRRVEKAGESIRDINYGGKYKALGEQLKANYDTFKVECDLKENKNYEDNESFCCDKNGDMPTLGEVGDNGDAAHHLSENENTQYEANVFFYHPDHLGSTSLVTNLDGEVTQHVAYIPYGEVFVEQRNGTWNTPYLFNAKELDEETGLYYYGARYLDPTGTRWLSVDPVFHAGSSPYAYCLGNPIRFSDPTGMWEWDENGNLKAQKGDNSYSMAKFLGTSQKNAMKILERSGVTVNEKGVLNLKTGQILDKSTLWVESKSTSGVVVNNSKEATKHYLHGNGEAADVGEQSTKELLNTDKFKAKHHKITNEKVDSHGYFSIDMTDLTFHIGHTNVDYDISSNGKSQQVKYTLFARDGYWDPDFIDEKILGKLGSKRHQPDGKGPNLERFGGTPYDYKTRERVYFFKPIKADEPIKVKK